MSIWANTTDFLCHVNCGLGDGDVIGPSWCFTLSLKGVMPIEGMTTFETTLVILKEGALNISKIQQVRAIC